jgi:hypothetical protein
MIRKMQLPAGSVAVTLWLFVSSSVAATADPADFITVSACETKVNPPVSFSIDCSHVLDPVKKKFCGPFIENVACKVFPAYREITGIRVESHCPSILYTIFEDANWPHGRAAGGLSKKCEIDYMAVYSILVKSPIGPYDEHEILHQYNAAHALISKLHVGHPLFYPVMQELELMIGDQHRYDEVHENTKLIIKRILDAPEKRISQWPETECGDAQNAVASHLYIVNKENAYRFYRELNGDPEDGDVLLSKLLFEMSGRENWVRKFPAGHGCSNQF